MKTPILTIFAVFCGMASLYADVAASVRGPVSAGETVEYRIKVDGDETPAIDKLPQVEGLLWGRGMSVSSKTTIVNFKRSSFVECVLTFNVSKPGKYEIPPVHVRVGRMKMATNPVSFEALASSSAGGVVAPDGTDSSLFLRAATLSGKSVFYVGERIPLEVRLYRLPSVRISQISYPEFDFGPDANVVFKDYKGVNPENPNFAPAREGRAKVDGRAYDVVVFSAAVRALSPGKFPLKAGAKVWVVPEGGSKRRGSLFDDDFFFGQMGLRDRTSERSLEASGKEIEILPLPPAPKDAVFTGLVGDWALETSLNDANARVGEPLTLRVKIRGDGAPETLKVPQLDLPGFRVYPPELDKNASGAEIRYVLIPTAEGDSEIAFDACVFDTAAAKYEKFPFRKLIKVGKALSLAGSSAQGQVVIGAQDSGQGGTAVQASTERSAHRPNGVLYLKRFLGGGVSLPLWRNVAMATGLVLAFGFLGTLGLLYFSSRRAALAADPKYARRNSAQARRRAVLKALKGADEDGLQDVASTELLPYLSDLVDAPPGAGASELSEMLKTRSPELSACLEELAGSAWAPGLKRKFDASFKSRLLSAASKFAGFVALCLLAFPSFADGAAASPAAGLVGAGASATANAKPSIVGALPIPDSPEAAMTAYDKGDFKGAAAFYKSKLDSARPSPAILYNLGNCLYQAGELPRALLCYERALRLAPRDSDILENLNLVRRKLDLPELYRLESPLDLWPYLRDSLRPDEWLLLASFGLALAMLSFGVRTLRRVSFFWVWQLCAGVLLLVFALVCFSSQSFGSYSEDQAIILIRNAQARKLPSATAETSDLRLRPGEQVSVLERRGDWLLVRNADGEGWLERKDASALWRSNPAQE